MENKPNRKFSSRKLLCFLHIFLGTGAVFGGLGLVIDPSGALIMLSVSLLENSPFRSFLIPGIILFAMLGILPLIVSYGLIRKTHWELADNLNIFQEKHWAWTYSLYISFMLIIWITIQVYLIKQMALIHVVYIFYGLLIQGLTLLPSVQKHYTV